MAITILQQPKQLSLVGENQNYLVSSTTSEDYIICKIIDSNNTLINTFNLYKIPNSNTIKFDVKKILENYVDFDFSEFDNTLVRKVNQTFTYNLNLNEIGDDTTTFVLNQTIIYGSSDIISNLNINLSDYTLTANDSTIKEFLTNKPNFSVTTDNNFESLYFYNSNRTDLFIKINAEYSDLSNQTKVLGTSTNVPVITNDSNYILIKNIKTTSKALSSLTGLIKLDVSLDSLIANGIISTFENLLYYRVSLIDANGNNLTDYYTFIVEKSDCRKSYLNLFFEGKFGTIETLNLYSIVQNVTNSKTYYKANTETINNNSISEWNKNIYNKENIVLSNNSVTTIKGYTNSLTDEDNLFVSEIINSNNIYCLIEGKYIPIKCNTTTFDFQIKRFADNNNIKELEFELPSKYLTNYKK